MSFPPFVLHSLRKESERHGHGVLTTIRQQTRPSLQSTNTSIDKQKQLTQYTTRKHTQTQNGVLLSLLPLVREAHADVEHGVHPAETYSCWNGWNASLFLSKLENIGLKS